MTKPFAEWQMLFEIPNEIIYMKCVVSIWFDAFGNKCKHLLKQTGCVASIELREEEEEIITSNKWIKWMKS